MSDRWPGRRARRQPFISFWIVSYEGYPELSERLRSKQLDPAECVVERPGELLRVARVTLRDPDGNITRRLGAYRDLADAISLNAIGLAQDEDEQRLPLDALMSVRVPSPVDTQ